MANEFIITTIVGILTGLGGWFTARKKNNADAKMSELDVIEKAIAVWRNIAEDWQKRYDALQQRYDELHERQIEMEKELDGLRIESTRLQKENKRMIQKITNIGLNENKA